MMSNRIDCWPIGLIYKTTQLKQRKKRPFQKRLEGAVLKISKKLRKISKNKKNQ